MSLIKPEIALRFHAGDMMALETVINHFQTRLFRIGLGFFKRPEDAADFAQDVFLRAFEQRTRYNPQRPFEYWFFKVAINLGRNRLRRQREFPASHALPEKTVEARAEVDAIAREEHLLVQQALKNIKPRYRESLILRFEADLSLENMAKSLGVPLGTAKSRLRRGLWAFQKAYQKLGGEIRHALPQSSKIAC
ncbi:sigma-70 family RNA polymerase sigma factor [bacterium]|nr:sigma-70 family RNA polymerase sigma factor [bacterium]